MDVWYVHTMPIDHVVLHVRVLGSTVFPNTIKVTAITPLVARGEQHVHT